MNLLQFLLFLASYMLFIVALCSGDVNLLIAFICVATVFCCWFYTKKLAKKQ